MDKPLKVWEKPQLIFLARGLPGESVLTGCKTQNPAINIDGPLGKDLKDKCGAGPGKSCNNCQPRAYDVS